MKSLSLIAFHHVFRHDVTVVSRSIYRLNNNNNNYYYYYFYYFIIIIVVVIVVVNCNWVVTRWQWLFYMYTKYEIGY